MQKPFHLSIIILLLIIVILTGGLIVIVTRNQQRLEDGMSTPPNMMDTDDSLTPPANDDVRLETPEAGSSVSSPLTIRGTAKNSWFFEGVFPVKLVADDGTTITSTTAVASEDWTQEGMIPFTASLSFNTPESATNAELVFMNDNPSGLPENAKEFRVPVILSK